MSCEQHRRHILHGAASATCSARGLHRHSGAAAALASSRLRHPRGEGVIVRAHRRRVWRRRRRGQPVVRATLADAARAGEAAPAETGDEPVHALRDHLRERERERAEVEERGGRVNKCCVLCGR